MISIKYVKLIQIIQEWILILLFSFDFLTYITNEDNVVKIKLLYYAILLLLYIFCLCLLSKEGRLRKDIKKGSYYFIFIFILFYLMRLIVDLLIKDIDQPIYTNNYTGVFLFVNAVFLPFIMINKFDVKILNFKKVQIVSGCILLFCVLISLYNFFYTIDSLLSSKDGRMNANLSLDSISLGHMGVSAFIFGIFLYSNYKIKKHYCYLSFFVMSLGVVVSLIAGSRGPIVALIICSLTYLYASSKKVFLFLLASIFLFLFLFYGQLNEFLMENYNIYSLQRIGHAFQSINDLESTLGSRSNIYKTSIDSFLGSPLFGSSFVIKGAYVHNSVIEAFMATGIIGGCFFLIALLINILQVIRLVKEYPQYIFIALLSMQYIIFSMFSRSLTIIPVFWFSFFVVNKIYVNRKCLNRFLTK